MHLRILKNGDISLTRIHPVEFHALLAIPQHADPSDLTEAQQRLYQKPVLEHSGEDFESISALEEDWQEIVVPELKSLFAGSLQRVEENLKAVSLEAARRRRKKKPADETPEEADPFQLSDEWTAALTIAAGHVEDWFRAMNQARLVMAERGLWVGDYTETHGPLLLRLHYEIYTTFQQWLVENVLR